MSEESDPDLSEEEYIRMDEIRDDHWRDDSEEGCDKKNIHALRWEVYAKDNEDLMKREVLVSIPYPKGGGGVVWTCVKYHIIDEKEQYEAIGICDFGYKSFG